MKCQDLWKWIETGSFVRRLLARRHAARCPKCAESLDRLRAVRRALAQAEPLSQARRALWARAAQTGVPPRRASIRRVAVLTGAAAAVVLLAAAVWTARRWLRGESPSAPPGRHTPIPHVARKGAAESPLRRIQQVRSGLLALSEELEALSRQAAMLDERQHVDRLLRECQRTARRGHQTWRNAHASFQTLAVGPLDASSAPQQAGPSQGRPHRGPRRGPRGRGALGAAATKQ